MSRTKFTITKYGLNVDLCPFCLILKDTDRIENRRLNTQYIEEERNWFLSCYECYVETCNYYQEMWDEYYAGLL